MMGRHHVQEVPTQCRLRWTGILERRIQQRRVLKAKEDNACLCFLRPVFGEEGVRVVAGILGCLCEVFRRRELPGENPLARTMRLLS